MSKKQIAQSRESHALFAENEQNADRYSSVCLLVASGMLVVMWILNLIGFFIVDKTMMNLVMPIGLILFLLPPLLVLLLKKCGAWIKYLSLLCFIGGVGAMSAVLTIHLIMAWACPLVLSLHYYSPRFTRFVLIASLLCMLIALYSGIYVGVWDCNIMRSNQSVVGIAERHAFIQKDPGLYLRAFNFYYLPRAVTILVIYAICETLSGRTHGLLERQSEIIMDRERLGAELDVARHIQSSMLPCIFPAFPEREEFEIHATMNPAKEVGGDFYDFFMVDDRHLAIVMADVSGKGIPAALFMVIGKTLVKDHTQSEKDLGDVFGEVNRLLCESNSEGLFITAFEGVLDLCTGRFVFVNAGHEMPFIRREGCLYVPYKIRPGFVLAGMEMTKYRQGEIMLEEGDCLFQYTDGVTEATNASNELFGMDRLGQSLNRARDCSPHELLDAVKADIDEFVAEAPQFDDITMLCLNFKKKMKENKS